MMMLEVLIIKILTTLIRMLSINHVRGKIELYFFPQVLLSLVCKLIFFSFLRRQLSYRQKYRMPNLGLRIQVSGSRCYQIPGFRFEIQIPNPSFRFQIPLSGLKSQLQVPNKRPQEFQVQICGSHIPSTTAPCPIFQHHVRNLQSRSKIPLAGPKNQLKVSNTNFGSYKSQLQVPNVLNSSFRSQIPFSGIKYQHQVQIPSTMYEILEPGPKQQLQVSKSQLKVPNFWHHVPNSSFRSKIPFSGVK